MNPSPACLRLVQKCESCKLSAYLDSGGVPTIGWGHTGPEVHLGLTWTQAQADAAFMADLAEAAASVAKFAPSCTQGQFDALTDFAYNCGAGNLQTSTLLHLHNGGNHNAAAAQFGQWVHDNGVILGGLVKRRAYEVLLYLGETI